jgi:hypothetical protein
MSVYSGTGAPTSDGTIAAVCPTSANDPVSYTINQALEFRPSGVIKPLFDSTVQVNATTGRINQTFIEQYIKDHTGIFKPRPTKNIEGAVETDMDALIPNDKTLLDNLKADYCFFEHRYKYIFKEFLKMAASRLTTEQTQAPALLEAAKKLNIRLNFLLELMAYMANARVNTVQQNVTNINDYNELINSNVESLSATYEALNKDKAIIRTQEAMVKYTQEKNNYNANQITLWSTLNIVALGVIFYVYRN